jgi:lipoprotein-releasing system permease protein
LNYNFYIAKRITLQSKRSFSKLIVRIAIGGIALGLLVMLMSIGIIRGFKSTIKDKLNGFSGQAQITAYQPNQLENNYFIRRDVSIEQQIKSVKGVKNIFSYASKISLLKLNNRVEPVVFKGVSDINAYEFLIQNIVEGSRINNANEVLVSKLIADKFKLQLNESALFYFADRIIKIRKLKVVGVYETGIEELDRNTIICDLALIRSVNDWSENQTGAYQLILQKDANLDNVIDDLNNFLPLDQKAISNQELFPAMYDWVELLNVNAKVIIILMLLVAGINMISALLILILERTSFIGILKTLGAGNRDIRSIFAYNATYLIGLGLLIGNVLSIVFYQIQIHTHLIKLDQRSYFMSYVPIDLNLSDFLWLNAATYLVSMVFVYLASLLITRISPLKAIRFS